MLANYHTHTYRCKHARGTEESYVLAAMEQGIQILGFSDHTPYFFPGNYVSTFRMLPEELRGYTDCISALAEKYRDKIEIHIGLEAEYYPKYFGQLRDFLKDYPVEYLILGQHCVGNEPDGFYPGAPTAEESLLRQYCRQVMDAMQTGLFTYVAHPDIINFKGDPHIFLDAMRELAREAVSCGIPLELNLLGIRENRTYPSMTLLEAAALEDCPIILGIDAHDTESISNTEQQARAKSMLQRFGNRVVETTVLRDIRR